MKNISFSLVFVLSISSHFIHAQVELPTIDSLKIEKVKMPQESIVKFLYSYYEQSGDHSPVTGGVGTEYLTDHVGKVIITMPFKGNSISISGGIDKYTSASTDNIDPNMVSSASASDERKYFSAGWSKEDKTKGNNFGFNAGISKEWDVFSINGGFFGAKTFNNGNSQIQFGFQHFSDRWDLIYPVEMRFKLPEDSTAWRRVYDLSLQYSQAIGERLQFGLSAQYVLQTGMLSTPFHRVYFQEKIRPRIERLPEKRIKIPLSIRLNYFISESLMTRLFYRFYMDDFGIEGNTISIEFPIKPNENISFIPFYRYHQQTAANYFAPINAHIVDEEFYTSDYDLSAFNSHKYGIGIRYSPTFGILNSPNIPWVVNKVIWKEINFRGGYYSRTDGLSAWIFSLGLVVGIYH